MKLKNTESFASMDMKHLQDELVKAQDELSQALLQQRMRNAQDVSVVGKLKKKIAVIQTYLTAVRKQSVVTTK